MRSLVAELGDLVIPHRCVSCARSGPVLCGRCQPPADPIRVADVGGLPVFAAGPYEDALRSAVLAYKERGRRDVGRALAHSLTGSVRAVLENTTADGRGPVALVPVPSSRAAMRARGGAHVLRLARQVARRSQLPVAPDTLVLGRLVADSAGLTIDERAANLNGAIRAASAPPAVAALVVDDIVTTGATLAECVRALRDAGWPVVGCAVIAATPRYHPAGSHGR